jgi:catechol 2,3-dioxygenase-like lactoylglutathione lyase family enzyme
MDWKIEVIPVPVADVDRAKNFYADKVGFTVDLDTQISDTMRIVQLTPPGSGCSIVLGSGTTSAPGMLQGVQLVVDDIETARAELLERGVDATAVRHFDNGDWIDGHGGPWNSFVFFSDPDGNGWVLQERPAGD